MSKTLYVIIDGMSESVAVNSSLAQAKTPTLDLIASTGKAGFYTPVISRYHTEPKTDVVVPALFGLSDYLNPGRAALELIDHDVMPMPGTYCCTLKLFVMPSVRNPDWRNSQSIEEPVKQEIIGRIYDIARRYGAAIQHSQATRYGEVYVEHSSILEHIVTRLRGKRINTMTGRHMKVTLRIGVGHCWKMIKAITAHSFCTLSNLPLRVGKTTENER